MEGDKMRVTNKEINELKMEVKKATGKNKKRYYN